MKHPAVDVDTSHCLRVAVRGGICSSVITKISTAPARYLSHEHCKTTSTGMHRDALRMTTRQQTPLLLLQTAEVTESFLNYFSVCLLMSDFYLRQLRRIFIFY